MKLAARKTRSGRLSLGARRLPSVWTIRAKEAGILSPKELPGDFEFSGHIDFKSADTGKDGKPTLPTFNLTAYTGKPMKVEGFSEPIIVDLEGATFARNTTPVIADHDTTRRVGHTTQQKIIPAGQTGNFAGKRLEGPIIAAAGPVSSGMGIASGFVEDAARGFPFQTSVGARVTNGYFLNKDEKATVNGKTWKGPLFVVSKSLIRELSVTVLGADGDTSATVAARIKSRRSAPPGNRIRSKTMNFDSWLKAMGLVQADLSEETINKLQAKYNAEMRAKGKPGITGDDDDDIEASEDDDDEEEELPPRRKAGKRIAASGSRSGSTRSNRRSNSRQLITAGGPLDDDDDDDDDGLERIRAVHASEDERVSDIRALFAEYDDQEIESVSLPIAGSSKPKKLTLAGFRAHAIKHGFTKDQTELVLIRAARPRSQGPGIHSLTRDVEAQAMECAILRHFNAAPINAANRVTGEKYGLEHWYKPETLEASHRPQYQFGGSIQALLDMQIRAAGKHYSGLDRGSKSFIAAAVDAWKDVQGSGFSTLNITVILENVLHKTALAGYTGVEAIWRFIAARRSLSDFKPHALYRLDLQGSFRKVATDGELKHVSMVDSKKTLQAETFGCMITLDRKTIKNDDMGLVVDQARGIGVLGGQRIEESVFVLLLSNPGSFFAAGNGNLITGATSVLSMGGLDLAKAKFRNQVINGKPVGLSPTILLVPTTLDTTASNLYNNETFVPLGATDRDVFPRNPHKGLYRPYVSPWLNNTAIRDQDNNAIAGQSDTQWYLLADPNAPQGAAIVIGFLDGRETPYFDEADTDFNVPGGIQFRSYLDWGVNMHMTQHAVKSAGA